MNMDPSDAVQNNPIPVVQVGRPMPLPKSKTMTRTAKGPGLAAQAKKIIFGAQSTIDPRQKKAAVLVGILSLVFGVVIFISLSGVSGKGVAKAKAADTDQMAQNQSVEQTLENWEKPAPIPENLRNATVTVIKHSGNSETNALSNSTSALVVKGIVFSENKPSAIINNEILTEGQTINGVKITKITKDAVEFQADQKRWTQGVQR